MHVSPKQRKTILMSIHRGSVLQFQDFANRVLDSLFLCDSASEFSYPQIVYHS